MVVGDDIWAHWLERLYNLRRDKRGGHERPHKPVLLLSILDLLDRNLVVANEIPLSEELVATFKRYSAVVRIGHRLLPSRRTLNYNAFPS